MQSRVVPIGNSHVIRIPKQLLEQSGISGEVELEVREGQIIIRATRQPRAGWDAAFREMADHGDDILRDTAASATAWDAAEWEW
ncbi:MAG TPA: AbrB/MazE/SpoVT family DNA-binding domain-containing protein [Longimicrobium sp.]|jgi:antitoxin MazE